MAEKKNKILERARVELNYLTGDAEIRRLAELREKWEMDYISAKAESFSDGREEGLEEGRQENKLEIAKKLLKKGMSIEEIEEITELTKEVINRLI